MDFRAAIEESHQSRITASGDVLGCTVYSMGLPRRKGYRPIVFQFSSPSVEHGDVTEWKPSQRMCIGNDVTRGTSRTGHKLEAAKAT